MGLKILGTDIAGLVAKALGPGALVGTLRSVTAGTRTPADLAGGTNPTYTEHTFRGFASETLGTLPLSVVQKGNRAVLILGDTISPPVAPKADDEITFEGEKGHILGVERDPDAAAYRCWIRD